MTSSTYRFQRQAPEMLGRAAQANDLRLRIALFLGAAMFLPLQALASSIPSPMPRTSANVAEQYLLSAANRERAALGIPQLRADAVLSQAARFHALQMASHAGLLRLSLTPSEG